MTDPLRVHLDGTILQRTDRVTGWERFARLLFSSLRKHQGQRPLLDMSVAKGPWSDAGGKLGVAWRHTLWHHTARMLPSLAECDVYYSPAIPPPPGLHPYVWTVHDSLILGHEVRNASRGARQMATWSRNALRNPGLIVTDTQAIATELKGLGVTEERIRVVPVGVGLEQCEPRRPPSFPYCPGEFVLTVGTIERRKRPDLAEAAARRLGLPIVFAGYVATDRLRDLDLSPDSQVLFLGPTSDGELEWLYQGAMCLLTTSDYEGANLPIREALARGLPVVATSIPAHLEVAHPGITYFSPGNLAEACAALSAGIGMPPYAPTTLVEWSETANSYADIFMEFL